MGSLSAEFAADGRLELFHRIKGYLTGDGDLKYAELGAELNLTESGVKSAIRRMREYTSHIRGLRPTSPWNSFAAVSSPSN